MFLSNEVFVVTVYSSNPGIDSMCHFLTNQSKFQAFLFTLFYDVVLFLLKQNRRFYRCLFSSCNSVHFSNFEGVQPQETFLIKLIKKKKNTFRS